ncbi:DUF998 domain-containing protein [Pseudonocardia halophobica]|uniref:DUF998 domain-containing protein n=1 Tax=Pseudonocardia halophobica TaxID=29401 RepID=UPI003D89CE77
MAAATTRSLLGWGVVAGPFYLVVGLAQALTRAGFDLTRHPLTALLLGDLGWLQLLNFLLTGLMTGGCGGRLRPRAPGPHRPSRGSAARPVRALPRGQRCLPTRTPSAVSRRARRSR